MSHKKPSLNKSAEKARDAAREVYIHAFHRGEPDALTNYWAELARIIKVHGKG